MKNISLKRKLLLVAGILFIIADIISYYAYQLNIQTESPINDNNSLKTAKKPLFSCDDRNQCSQMTSCAEALFFLNNCNRKGMDRNNNGIPCEKQWCNKGATND